MQSLPTYVTDRLTACSPQEQSTSHTDLIRGRRQPGWAGWPGWHLMRCWGVALGMAERCPRLSLHHRGHFETCGCRHSLDGAQKVNKSFESCSVDLVYSVRTDRLPSRPQPEQTLLKSNPTESKDILLADALCNLTATQVNSCIYFFKGVPDVSPTKPTL